MGGRQREEEHMGKESDGGSERAPKKVMSKKLVEEITEHTAGVCVKKMEESLVHWWKNHHRVTLSKEDFHPYTRRFMPACYWAEGRGLPPHQDSWWDVFLAPGDQEDVTCLQCTVSMERGRL
jgi:hypothetical protein